MRARFSSGSWKPRRFILHAKRAVYQRLLRSSWANQLGLRRSPPVELSVLVNSIYKAAFGRVAGPEGLASRIHQLQSGASLEALAEELVSSAEFLKRHGSSQRVDADYLTALYRHSLGREPDPEGLAHWLAEGENGARRAKVLAAFAASPGGERGRDR